jgi:hypothetical protein
MGKSDSNIKRSMKRLAMELNAECIVASYHSDGTLHLTAIVNGNIMRDYDVPDRKKYQKSKACVVEYSDSHGDYEASFESLRKAAKYFDTTYYALKKGIPFKATKPFRCTVTGVKYGE